MDDPDEAVVNVINPDEDDEEVIEGSLLVDGGVLAANEDPPATTKTLSKFSEAWRWRLCPEEEAGTGVLDVFRIPHVESR